MVKISPIKRRSKLSKPRLLITRSIISLPVVRHHLPAPWPHPSRRQEREDSISHRSQSILWRGALRRTLRGPYVHPAPRPRWWEPRPERRLQTRHGHETSSEYLS